VKRPAANAEDVGPPVEMLCKDCGALVRTHLVDYVLKKNGEVLGEGTRRELLPHGECPRRLP
jgi:hypothetical protein